ncbi:MAG: threonine--tRNA ligase [Erysipelotrichaceae bacterium]|jgi:threonyl-tRNA synthetase|nr:threonine--tRNA ligase [Erysipelotrichaceae bacterium]
MKVQQHDGSIIEIEKSAPEALEVLNHSTSHLLAQAVKQLYPFAKFGFGPAIENGFYYDIDFGDKVLVEEDLPIIEKKMKELASKDLKIVRNVVNKQEALELFKDNPYKLELISEINEDITIFSQGEFVDLCRGPHLMSTALIKHFKLLSLAGAYWRGDSNNKQLTRIYGTSWYTDEELKNYLNLIEERKKRDHRLLGKQLGLFFLSEYGPGFPFWLPNGMILRENIEKYWKEQHFKYDYSLIKTPTMLSRELWEISGHWFVYKENMYTTKIDDRDFAIKPMNCPGSILVYKNSLHSYKDLPIRMAELGHVHRHEASGALNGLFRVRAFTQDDAHIFCREDQLVEEITTLLKFFEEMYSIFDLDYYIVLSTRPEEGYIGDIKTWDKSEAILMEACQQSGREFKINPGDGAFYGPKLDFKLKDSVGRIWQCGTIQLDMNLPERFDCFYIDGDGEKKRPIMLHRACLGSIERFIGIIIEHFGGAFPTWLAPLQVNILPVNNAFHLDYAKQLFTDFKARGLRVKLDDSNDKLGYRMRSSQMRKVPFTLVLGDQERDNKTVTYRRFGVNEQITVSVEEFLKLIDNEVNNRLIYKVENK